MADVKISGLPAASTPVAGTEVLPIVQSTTTKKLTIDDLIPKQIRSNSTTGILQVTGPATASTRVMTTPDANFTAARTDAAQTFTGDQTFADVLATGYELLSGGILTESGTTRTLSATDNGKIVYCTSGSATTITCASGLGAGFSCTIIQGGAGKVTVAAGGQTLVSYSSLFSTMGQYAVISLVCPVANTFVAAGNLGV
jgi:hypothetical protein